MDVKSTFTHGLCRHYLIHSYIYYTYNNSVISDELYDEICKELLSRFKSGEEIPKEFKKFITIDDLEAGTGFSIAFCSLPNRIISIATTLHTGIDICGNKINYEDWLI